MDKLNWEKALPEVSKGFHSRLETTLGIISLKKEATKNRMSKKLRILLVAAAVVVVGSITASAADLFKWNRKVSEKFEASEQQQNDLILKGVAEKKEAGVSNNGLTISLVQTLQDKDYIYIALEVTAPDDIKLGDTNLFEASNVRLSGAFKSTSGGFMAQKETEELTNSRLYEYWIHKAAGTNLDGTEITLSFKNLQADAKKLDMYTILEGEWNLSWTLNFSDSTRYYDLNRNYNLSGHDVLVKRVEISPLSMTIYYKDADIKNMEKAEGVDLSRLDSLDPIQLAGFQYKDGTSIQIHGGGGGGEGFDKNTGEYIYTVAFEKIITVEDVECILLGKDRSPIRLN